MDLKMILEATEQLSSQVQIAIAAAGQTTDAGIAGVTD